MLEINNILVSKFSQYLTKHLGERVTKKVDKILEEHYHVSFEYAVANFEIMEKVLFCLFGNEYKGIVVGLLQDICTMETQNKQEKQYRITINDKGFFKKILDAMQDRDKKMIMENTSPVPLTTSEIVALVKSSEISVIDVLKKIDELIEDNFIVVVQTDNDDVKSEPKYLSTISGTKWAIKNNEMELDVLFTSPLEESKLISYITK